MANGLIEEELGTNKIMLIKPEDILIKTDLENGIVAKILDKKYSMAKIKYELLINGMELIVDDYRKNDLEIGSEVGIEIKNYIVFRMCVMKKVIFDCDNTMGISNRDIDDGLALLYLINNLEVELKGITCTYGNDRLDKVFTQTVKLIDDLSLEIPVLKAMEITKS